MLDIIKILLNPTISLIEKVFNKNDYRLKQLKSVKNKGFSEHYQKFSKNRQEEISFRVQTGISTNYLTIGKILTLYEAISMKTKDDIRILKRIFEFIKISEEKAFIEIKPVQKYLGIGLFWLSLVGIVMTLLLILSSLFFEIFDVKNLVTMIAYIFFFIYFLGTSYPVMEAIRIKKVLEK